MNQRVIVAQARDGFQLQTMALAASFGICPDVTAKPQALVSAVLPWSGATVVMGSIGNILTNVFGGSSLAFPEQLQQALHSLQARGSITQFTASSDAPDGFRLQWDRGNFGELLGFDKRGGKTLLSAPVALAVGPFARKLPVNEIQPISDWQIAGNRVVLGAINRLGQVELIDTIREREAHHPAIEWLGKGLRELAEGRSLPGEKMEAMLLLGFRRFVKTIPNADRLNEVVEAALVTLLGMARREKAQQTADEGADIFSIGGGFAQAMLECLQESHPLELKRAGLKFVSMC